MLQFSPFGVTSSPKWCFSQSSPAPFPQPIFERCYVFSRPLFEMVRMGSRAKRKNTKDFSAMNIWMDIISQEWQKEKKSGELEIQQFSFPICLPSVCYWAGMDEEWCTVFSEKKHTAGTSISKYFQADFFKKRSHNRALWCIAL